MPTDQTAPQPRSPGRHRVCPEAQAKADAIFSAAFGDLEGPIHDVAQISRIAARWLDETVGGVAAVVHPNRVPRQEVEDALFLAALTEKLCLELRDRWLKLHNEGARHERLISEP